MVSYILSSNADTSNGYVRNKITKINKYAKGAKHPYNTTGNLGWIDESNIKLKSETTNQYHIVKKGDTLWELALKYYGSGTKYKIIKALNNLSSNKIILYILKCV